MIGLIDYGLGNIQSFSNILKNFKTDYIIPSNDSDIKKCEKFILPGVGSFDEAVKKLKSKIFFSNLENQILNEKKKILGICVGMQVFLNNSEEGKEQGLGWVQGEVKRFSDKNFRIPHMGWNSLNVLKKNKLLENLDNSEFYFLHSYFCIIKNNDNILSKTFYSTNFCSSFISNNIYGVQFHPEKSHDNGLKVIKNFINL